MESNECQHNPKDFFSLLSLDHTSSAQGIFLPLCSTPGSTSGIMPGGLREVYEMLENESHLQGKYLACFTISPTHRPKDSMWSLGCYVLIFMNQRQIFVFLVIILSYISKVFKIL